MIYSVGIHSKKSYQKRLPRRNSVPNSNFYLYPRQTPLKTYYSESLESTNNKYFHLKTFELSRFQSNYVNEYNTDSYYPL